jgi:hypothetical protein
MYIGSLGNIILIVFGIPLTLVALVGLFWAMFLLMPEPIAEARKNFQMHPWRSIALGALNALGVVAIIVLLKSLLNWVIWDWQNFILIGMAVLGLLAAIPTLIGLSGLVMIVSDRIGHTTKPFLTYLRGGGLLLLACITPVIGWFIFFPLVIFASLGSVVALLARPKQNEPLTLPIDPPSN